MSRKHTPVVSKGAKSTGRRVAGKTVESSTFTNHRRRGEVPLKTEPRQPKLRPTPPRKPGPKPHGGHTEGRDKRAAALREKREKISLETTEAARATGMLPHEWMLAVMRGEQINHYAYDSESQEIIEVIVLPTFADRMECAKAAAPYFANKLQPEKRNPGGGFADPAKQPGVMEVPLENSMERWAQIAQQSQTLLKKEVTK